MFNHPQPAAVATPTQEAEEPGRSLSAPGRRTDGSGAQAQFPAPSGVFLFPGFPSIPAGGRRLFTVFLWLLLALCFVRSLASQTISSRGRLCGPHVFAGDRPMAERGELDLTGAKQNTGVWLVKVPKYLSQQWAKAPGRGEVGKLRIAK
ncbi:hypothetical protein MC885_019716 [Smutsia gigantea]|nr:hypothetical protein MC885_019716 [Smutsia gigantea]